MKRAVMMCSVIMALLGMSAAWAEPPVRMPFENTAAQYRVPRVVESPIGSHIAGDFSFDPKYEAMLIESRAKHRAKAHNGRVRYEANTIRATDAETIDPDARHLVVSSDTTSVYNLTIMKGNYVKSSGSSFEFGNLTHYGDAEELVNMVKIKGVIMADQISIGNVKNVGKVRRIFNGVNCDGVVGP